MANKTSNHILGTSATLLGFCLIVLTNLHVSNFSENNFIDELTSVVTIFLTISTLLSFISIRTDDFKKEQRLEQVSDYFFLGSLIGIFGIIVLIVFHFWK